MFALPKRGVEARLLCFVDRMAASALCWRRQCLLSEFSAEDIDCCHHDPCHRPDVAIPSAELEVCGGDAVFVCERFYCMERIDGAMGRASVFENATLGRTKVSVHGF
jgi:hypothetical protein